MWKGLKILVFMIVLLPLAVLLFLLYATITDFSPSGTVELPVEGAKFRQPVEDTLTLVSWNIGYAGLGKEMDFFYDGGRMVRPAKMLHKKYWTGIRQEMKSMADSADFILLQEIDIGSKRSYHTDQLSGLKHLLGGHSFSFALNYRVDFVPIPVLSPMGKVRSGLATIGKIAPVSSQRHAFEGNYRWPVRVFMLDRGFIENRYYAGNGKQLVLINTHNSAFDDGELRMKQLETLRARMLGEYLAGNYVIAGGDWNMNPEGFHSYLCKTGDMHFKIEPQIEPGYFPAGWTWAFDQKVPSNRFLIESYLRTRTPTTTIDYFVLSPNVELLGVETRDLYFEDSDHHPVWINVRLAR